MKYFILGFILLLFSCNDNHDQEQLVIIKEQLAKANAKISQLQTQIESEGELVHLVFFKVKSNADQKAFVEAVKKLMAIKTVMDLEIGPFEDLGDDRALSEYTMLLQMSFADKAAYENYQQHPIHLALKKNIGQYMDGPPATYDFIKK